MRPSEPLSWLLCRPHREAPRTPPQGRHPRAHVSPTPPLAPLTGSLDSKHTPSRTRTSLERLSFILTSTSTVLCLPEPPTSETAAQLKPTPDCQIKLRLDNQFYTRQCAGARGVKKSLRSIASSPRFRPARAGRCKSKFTLDTRNIQITLTRPSPRRRSAVSA